MSLYIIGYVVIAILLLLLLNRVMFRKPNSEINEVTAPPAPQVLPSKQEVVSEPSFKDRFRDSASEVNVTTDVSVNPVAASNFESEAASNQTVEEPVVVKPAEVLDTRAENRAAIVKDVPKTAAPTAAAPHAELKLGQILFVILLGAFIAILNQTLLNVAIPRIMNDLNVSATTVQWLSTGYMLVNGVAIPLTAYLIERFGTRKLFIGAMVLFTIGSIICATSINFPLLMLGRVVQACGAGVIMPLMMTVFLTVFPPEKRGAAMGMMGIAMIFAPAIGPTLSGWLVEHYNWRLLFYIVIPFGIIDILFAIPFMKDVTKISKPKLDFAGALFSTVGFGGMLYGFSQVGTDGWGSGTVIGWLSIGALFIILFIWRELTADKPMLDLRVFKYNIFSLTTVIGSLVNMAMFGAMILLPIYLQNIRGFTPVQSGLLMLPGSILMGIMSPIAGRLFDRFGARWLAVIGLTITALTTYQFTKLTSDTTYNSILLLYTLRMFGMSFIMMTVMTAGMNQLPLRLNSHGTAASNTARTVAGSLGTALLVSVMTSQTKVHMADYGNAITSTNPYVSSQFGMIGQYLSLKGGLPTPMGNEITTQLMYGLAMKQSTIEGINDAFFYATGFALVALVMSFFIKRIIPEYKKQPQKAPQAKATEKEVAVKSA